MDNWSHECFSFKLATNGTNPTASYDRIGSGGGSGEGRWRKGLAISTFDFKREETAFIFTNPNSHKMGVAKAGEEKN